MKAMLKPFMKSYWPLAFILLAFAFFFLSCEKEENEDIRTKFIGQYNGYGKIYHTAPGLDTLYYEYNITVYVEKSVELENNIIIWSNGKDRHMSNDKNEYILKSDSTFNIDISLIQIDPPMGSGRFYPNDSIYWWRNFLFGDKTRYFYGSKE